MKLMEGDGDYHGNMRSPLLLTEVGRGARPTSPRRSNVVAFPIIKFPVSIKCAACELMDGSSASYKTSPLLKEAIANKQETLACRKVEQREAAPIFIPGQTSTYDYRNYLRKFGESILHVQ